MSKQNSFYRRQTRGVLLYNLYLAWDNGLNDPAQPKTMNGQSLELALRYRATLPPEEDLVRALQWLEDCEYITVEWEMDDKTHFENVTITQKGIRLCEDKKAGQTEPDVLLPPRR